MSCGKCVKRVAAALEADAGVAEAAVELAARRARVRLHRADAGATARLAAAVQALGFGAAPPARGAAPPALRLEVGGMSCGKCVRRVTKALEGLPGAGTVEVRVRPAARTGIVRSFARGLPCGALPARLPCRDRGTSR
jgi:Cu+-exporting ATPase